MGRYRLVAEGKLLGQQVVTVLHYASVGFSASAEDLAEAFPAEVQIAWADAAPASLGMESVTVTDIDTLQQAVEPWIFNGLRIGDISGPQLCGLIAWRTNQAGRSKRGRTYFPGLIEGDAANGMLTTQIQTLLGTLAGELMAITGALATYELNVYSRSLGLMQTVTSYIVRDEVKTQRRRAIGTGS